MKRFLVVFSVLLYLHLASTSPPPDWRKLIDKDVYEYTINKGSPENGDKFEGDIDGLNATAFEQNDVNGPVAHNALLDSAKLWPDGVVPYNIQEADFTTSEVSVIKDALADVMKKTCLKFVPLRSEKDHLRFVDGPDGCDSFIGRLGGPQAVHLGKGCATMIGEVQHEVMHALGFYHEQTRWDRDDYVTIYMENIEPTQRRNFEKFKGRTFNLPYDYGSVMHYGFKAFSADGKKPTILPKTDSAPIGNRKVMSGIDVKKINILYGCSAPTEKGANIIECKPGQLPCGDACYTKGAEVCTEEGRISTCIAENIPCGNGCYNPQWHACNNGTRVVCVTRELPCGVVCYNQDQSRCVDGRVIK